MFHRILKWWQCSVSLLHDFFMLAYEGMSMNNYMLYCYLRIWYKTVCNWIIRANKTVICKLFVRCAVILHVLLQLFSLSYFSVYICTYDRRVLFVGWTYDAQHYSSVLWRVYTTVLWLHLVSYILYIHIYSTYAAHAYYLSDIFCFLFIFFESLRNNASDCFVSR